MLTNSLLGGILIGCSAVLLYGFIGRIAGISGISFGLLWGDVTERRWRLAFIAGLVLGGVVTVATGFPMPLASVPQDFQSGLKLVLAGLLVGFGTQLGNGCTSGHGICGVSRLSRRSLASVLVFMSVGMLVATLLPPWFG